MLKFIKHHLDTITGIGLYPTISFVLFFSFFLVVVLWLRRTGRGHFDRTAGLPIDGAPPATPENGPLS